MKTSKMIPVGFLALFLAGTSGLVATAQTAPVPPAAPQAQDQVQPQPPVPGQPQAQPRSKGPNDQDGPRGKRDGYSKHDGRASGGPGREGHGWGDPAMFQQLFTQIDTDQNGSITQAEIDAFRASKIGAADTSGDGALSIDEFDTLYREFTRTRMVRAFQGLDTDGDGVISAAEMDARFSNVVDRMDRDDDGALSLQDGGPRR